MVDTSRPLDDRPVVQIDFGRNGRNSLGITRLFHREFDLCGADGCHYPNGSLIGAVDKSLHAFGTVLRYRRLAGVWHGRTPGEQFFAVPVVVILVTPLIVMLAGKLRRLTCERN